MIWWNDMEYGYNLNGDMGLGRGGHLADKDQRGVCSRILMAIELHLDTQPFKAMTNKSMSKQWSEY